MINNGRVSHDIRVKKMCRKLFINLNLIKFIILENIFFQYQPLYFYSQPPQRDGGIPRGRDRGTPIYKPGGYIDLTRQTIYLK